MFAGDVNAGRAGMAVLGETIGSQPPPDQRRQAHGARPTWRLRRARTAPETLEALYREHVGSVYAFFTYSVGRGTAEDLTAATFERVVRAWSRFDAARASEETWIFAIARNVLIDHVRRQRHRAGPSLDEHPEIIERIASADDPLARAISAEAIASWLSWLRPRDRQVLALRYCVDLSVPEIASCLGLSDANVHQICSRALRRLRAVIAVSGEERPAAEASGPELRSIVRA
jgi:RNA polymerase sigma-70 factor (ECF subfamily)